jgi:hypothetical protein
VGQEYVELVDGRIAAYDKGTDRPHAPSTTDSPRSKLRPSQGPTDGSSDLATLYQNRSRKRS